MHACVFKICASAISWLICYARNYGHISADGSQLTHKWMHLTNGSGPAVACGKSPVADVAIIGVTLAASKCARVSSIGRGRRTGVKFIREPRRKLPRQGRFNLLSASKLIFHWNAGVDAKLHTALSHCCSRVNPISSRATNPAAAAKPLIRELIPWAH